MITMFYTSMVRCLLTSQTYVESQAYVFKGGVSLACEAVDDDWWQVSAVLVQNLQAVLVGVTLMHKQRLLKLTC